MTKTSTDRRVTLSLRTKSYRTQSYRNQSYRNQSYRITTNDGPCSAPKPRPSSLQRVIRMATAVQPVPALLTMEEYLHTSYSPDCDLVDGILEGRNVGEREHSVLQIAIGAWFFNRRKEWKIVVMSEQRTRVSDDSVRIPDVCLVATSAPNEKVTLTPPLLAIEILSSEDRMKRVLVRLKDFLSMGVENIWLLDPLERCAFTFSAAGLRLAEEPRLTIPGTPIYLDLPELFSALDPE
jgi:Uma2 family endonuclease